MSFFNKINIQTPESVELEFTLAGIGNRCFALLIDYLIWGASIILILLIWSVISIQIQDLLVNVENVELWLIAISFLTIFVVYTCYFVLFETLWQGQTPGKRFTKIRVIRDNGQPVKLTQSLLRSLLRSIDDILFIGMILIVFTPQEKRLGDWVAGTIVIQEERPVTSKKITVSSGAEPIAEELVRGAVIDGLMPDDFAVIREFLQRREIMDARAKANLSRELADQATQLMGMEAISFEHSPEMFLEGVYLAYQRERR